MNTAEVSKLLYVLRQYYPNDTAATNMVDKIKAWAVILADYSYQQMNAAARAFVSKDTKGFMPVPGQLIDEVHKLEDSQRCEREVSQAWALVKKALSNSLYHSAEEFERLPKLVQRAVGSSAQMMDWAMVSGNELDTVIASNFKREYRGLFEQEKQWERLPKQVKDAVPELFPNHPEDKPKQLQAPDAPAAKPLELTPEERQRRRENVRKLGKLMQEIEIAVDPVPKKVDPYQQKKAELIQMLKAQGQKNESQ